MKRRGFLGALAAIVAAPVAAKVVLPERTPILPVVDRDEDDATMDRCPRCGALAVRRVMFVQARSSAVSFSDGGYLPSPSGPIITEGCELCAGITPKAEIRNPTSVTTLDAMMKEVYSTPDFARLMNAQGELVDLEAALVERFA